MGADLGGQSEGGPMASINVTPFVDVVLVLLVIFMITAPTLMKDVIGIKLPKAASSDQKSPTSLGIAVNQQGLILINGAAVEEGLIIGEVKKALAQNPEVQAIVSADADAKHADVVKAIDLIKQAGLSRFALQIDRKQ